MKLRLTQPGFETYSAQMGVIFFENGLSTTDVSVMDATRMSAVMGCEWEDGTPSNVSQIYLDNMKTPAPLFVDADSATQDPTAVVQAHEKAAVAGLSYTEEQLAAIADKDGIAGLRVISEPLGIKGNSISGLISAILKAVGAPKAE